MANDNLAIAQLLLDHPPGSRWPRDDLNRMLRELAHQAHRFAANATAPMATLLRASSFECTGFHYHSVAEI